jgi:N-methylhydantoinase A
VTDLNASRSMGSRFQLPSRRYWIGIDIGGTFTDFVIYDSVKNGVLVHKALTPSSSRAQSVLEGLDHALERYEVDPADVAFIGHGTTVATNAIITGEGPPVGLITTAGFGDILVIRRQTRPDTFDYYADFPAPLVPRDRVREVTERSDARGEVVEPIDDASAIEALKNLSDAGVRSVAVSFLHSYANPRHEQMVSAHAALFPHLLVSLSSDLMPEFREYERTSTTVVNAFVRPGVIAYLTAFQKGLRERGVTAPLEVMQGNGGMMSVETADRQPVALIRSGPAAGVAGAAFLAGLASEAQIITLDMGGTSTDVAVFDGGRPPIVRDWHVFSFPIRWPTVDIRSIGAGGGSVAWVDGGGLLKVGPNSAGAEPGPACYDRGGISATLTDANVQLGRIGAEARLGGSITVCQPAAQAAIAKLAEQVGSTVEETAAGIIEIVNAAIAQEIHLICAERGLAARDFALVSFGGAGGLHASEVAHELGMTKVVIPLKPGLVSALGVLSSIPRADFGISRLIPMVAGNQRSAEIIETLRTDLELRAARWLDEQKIPSRERPAQEWIAELRYRGQNYELPVFMERGPIDICGLVNRFHEKHEMAYGYRSDEAAVDCVAVRLTVSVDVDHPPMHPRPNDRSAPAAGTRRQVHMGRRWGSVESAIYQRDDFPVGFGFTGPAVVEQMDATTLVLPDQQAVVDKWGNIELTKRADS